MVQSLDATRRRVLELNGGQIEHASITRFRLPPVATGYADAQIDDRGGPDERFAWRAPTTMALRARFSHPAGQLLGTAGFGFWNAPYGDPSRRRPALPRTAWFFYASSPSDLPIAPDSPGRGWFAATFDASTLSALSLAPLAPAVLALNWFAAGRWVWPAVRRRLGIYAAPISADMSEWHDYRLEWTATGCRFLVDDHPVLESPCSPRGNLGFVCWLDNQYLILTPGGRFRAGVLSLVNEQWMDMTALRLEA